MHFDTPEGFFNAENKSTQGHATKGIYMQNFPIQNESVLYSTVPLQLLFTLHFEFKVFIPPPPEKNIYFKAIQWGQVGEGVMQDK